MTTIDGDGGGGACGDRRGARGGSGGTIGETRARGVVFSSAILSRPPSGARMRLKIRVIRERARAAAVVACNLGARA